MKREDIRNVAIIAHVDHGKTTLVDGLLRQSGTFRQHEHVAERVMDSGDLERERGITILAKNTAVHYQGTKINIVDTPGHADFSGEVERIMSLVDGCILVVDSSEGPMAQTKFVLRKALETGLKPVVVINKIDRPDRRINEVIDEVLELFIDLGADDEQLEFPVLYASGRDGFALYDLNDEPKSLEPLFETIVKQIPAPEGEAEAPLQIMVASLDYDEFVGRIAIGRVRQGKIKPGQQVAIATPETEPRRAKVGLVYVYEGLKRAAAEEATVGEIVALTGLSEIEIGETVTAVEAPSPLPGLRVDEPTLTMTFQTSDSPFAGRDGKYITSRHLRSRLFKELEKNVALRVEETDSPDVFQVSGRGELHLSILIETMRREGYELSVSKPQVIMKEIDGVRQEPLEHLIVDLPEDYLGVVMEKLGARKAEMTNMINTGHGELRLEFIVPARGLIGFRSEFLTDTRGFGVMNHLFYGYGPYRGEMATHNRGSLIAAVAGTATAYALDALQDRGVLFIGPGTEVYQGMVVGENSREQDLEINVCRLKQLTNMRASGSDDAVRLAPPRVLSLEEALEQLATDELLEVTPHALRLRKKYLDPHQRAKQAKKAAGEG